MDNATVFNTARLFWAHDKLKFNENSDKEITKYFDVYQSGFSKGFAYGEDKSNNIIKDRERRIDELTKQVANLKEQLGEEGY